MSESVETKQTEKAPPFVNIIKTNDGCAVNHNIIDPWLVMALLEMGKDALFTDMKKKRIIKPTNGGLGGFAKRMGMRGA